MQVRDIFGSHSLDSFLRFLSIFFRDVDTVGGSRVDHLEVEFIRIPLGSLLFEQLDVVMLLVVVAGSKDVILLLLKQTYYTTVMFETLGYKRENDDTSDIYTKALQRTQLPPFVRLRPFLMDSSLSDFVVARHRRILYGGIGSLCLFTTLD